MPAAGRGTRLYPLTKAQPKEMMPVGPYPAIDWVIQELAAAEITEILVITGPGKSALEAHLDPQQGRLPESDRPPWLTEFDSSRTTVYFTRQNPPGGLGEAVACAQQFIGDEDFVVALGDSIIGMHAQSEVVGTMIEKFETSRAAAVIAFTEVPREEVVHYGIAAPKDTAKENPIEWVNHSIETILFCSSGKVSARKTCIVRVIFTSFKIRLETSNPPILAS